MTENQPRHKAGIDSLAGPGREQPRLKAIRLENIGPFQDFSLDLDAHWSILLGDNGVGKSTILKAIALALCGEDLRPYADRLIRIGAPSGRCTLETTEGARYVTELRRSAAEAKVISVPQPPLEIERWLALGFPPLRGLGVERSPGPQLGTGRRWSSPDDLLPLLSGGLDPRGNDLKQLIINLDYRVTKSQDRRSRQLFDDFFETVGRLTVGMKLGFGRVDPQTYQVTVETDDGEVPIEVVSQGTQSLLGWVTVLLQRMYEVYDMADQPREQPALVLIDEIDAHMHPRWQQAIVLALSELFPRVQFAATTHSPLIVGGMLASQVIPLSRDAEGRVVRLAVEEDMTSGRADQLLTSKLFGLETTFDIGTQRALERLQLLLSEPARSAAEERELGELRRVLALRIPAAAETPPERRASELVDALLSEHLAELAGTADPAQLEALRQTLLDKARKLLDAVLAERRPRHDQA